MSLIPAVITKPLFRGGLILQKNSPNILFVGGIAGVLASTFLACKGTLQLAEELPQMKEDLVAVREADLPAEEKKKAIAMAYSMNAMRVVRIYAPAAIVGTVSVGALTGSHVQLTRRNAAVTAAYAGLYKAYEDYREKVKEELGEDKELDIQRSIKPETLETPDGKKIKGKVVDPNHMSPYAVCFDQTCPNYQKNAEMNKLFILTNQNYFNHILAARGHVFLNEVYDALGFERTKEGAVVGWVLSDDGDNYIDFGLFEGIDNRFINGLEASVWLDFNVDGLIFDKI